MKSEADALADVAKRYQDEGYEVMVSPKGPALPPFMADFDVDLIAVKGEEHVVVEVKHQRSDIRNDPYIARLAALVNEQPGWRFDFVVAEPQSPIEKTASSSHEPSRVEIREMLNQAEHLLNTGNLRAAAVFGWAALEAAMREIRDAGQLFGRITPAELMRTLYSNGILSPEDFKELRLAFEIRTQIVHGMLTPNIGDEHIREMIEIGRRVLGSKEFDAD